jgi:hypothetical protein
MTSNSIPFYSVFFAVFLLLACVLPVFAHAAILSIEPSTGSYPVGEPFSVEVRVDTQGKNIGSADVRLSFEPTDLEYVGMSDEGSIFTTLLVDNDTNPGTIDLSGFIARGRESYVGNNGTIARVMFVPLRNTQTQVRFVSGAATPPLTLTASVGDLANIVTDLRSAAYILVPRESIASVSGPVGTVRGASDIRLSYDPEPSNGWIATSSVRLSWELPEGTTDMRTIVSTDSDATPTRTYSTPVRSVQLPNLDEGKQYFIIQFGVNGAWGPVIRHPLWIDTTPPSLTELRELPRQDLSDPRTVLSIRAEDDLSGIDRYEIEIDGGEIEIWNSGEDGTYRPTGLNPGEHVLTVRAFDVAGNSTSAEITFLVRSLDPPVLTDIPDYVLVGDPIVVRGITYPNSGVTVFSTHNDGATREYAVTSDSAGAFVATVQDHARAGKYTVWFRVKDQQGAESPLSIRRSVDVKQPYIMLFNSFAVTYRAIIIPLIASVLLLGLVLWLGYAYIRGYRRRVRRETNEAYEVVQEEFESLRDDLIRQIGMLEKANQSRELTREEMRIFDDLSRKLDNIERRIADEVSDIETVTLQPATSRNASRPQATEASSQQKPSAHTIHIERLP